jgi:hypothetical protein
MAPAEGITEGKRKSVALAPHYCFAAAAVSFRIGERMSMDGTDAKEK